MELRGPRLLLRTADLSHFLTEYLENRRSALPPEVHLSADIAPGIHCRFDYEGMTTVMRNLIENAILYSNGPPRVHVTLNAESNQCHLRVSDQGRGIDPSEQKKIFRMFYRSRRANDRIPGTGLGLFIVKVLVKRHKGKIRVESRGPGQGTTFHIILPRARTAEGE